MVIQAGALELLVIQCETQRLDEVQARAGIAQRRITLPVFGGISGWNRMTWNVGAGFIGEV